MPSLLHLLTGRPPSVPAESGTLIRVLAVGSGVRTPILASSLDALLGGGVESGALTEFYGEAASGKTNVCLQLARNVARAGRKVVYIDTEGVSLERLEQMCGADYKKVQQSILFFEPFSLREQEQVVEKAARLAMATPDVGLVVLDSATLLYRVALSATDGVRERRVLATQLQSLAVVARKRDVPVVMTNQVYTNVEQEVLEPLGGQLIRHLTKAVVRLDKAGPGRRKATLVKHRAMAEGQEAYLRLTMRGVEGDEIGGEPVGVPVRTRAEP